MTWKRGYYLLPHKFHSRRYNYQLAIAITSNRKRGILVTLHCPNKDLHKRNKNIGFQCGRSGSHCGHNEGSFVAVKQATGSWNVTTYYHTTWRQFWPSQNFVRCQTGIVEWRKLMSAQQRFDIVYDMIYLLTAIGLTPGGSSFTHKYTEQHNETEYPERNIQNKNT